MDTTNTFRTYLKHSLETKSRMNAEQVNAILARYDKAVAALGPENTFRELHEAYGTGDTNEAIKHALEQANKQTIDSNPITRLAEKTKRFKEQIKKLDIEVTNINSSTLAQHQLEGIKDARDERQRVANPQMPNLAFAPDGTLERPFYYTAVCSYKGDGIPFEISWTL